MFKIFQNLRISANIICLTHRPAPRFFINTPLKILILLIMYFSNYDTNTGYCHFTEHIIAIIPEKQAVR